MISTQSSRMSVHSMHAIKRFGWGIVCEFNWEESVMEFAHLNHTEYHATECHEMSMHHRSRRDPPSLKSLKTCSCYCRCLRLFMLFFVKKKLKDTWEKDCKKCKSKSSSLWLTLTLRVSWDSFWLTFLSWLLSLKTSSCQQKFFLTTKLLANNKTSLVHLSFEAAQAVCLLISQNKE